MTCMDDAFSRLMDFFVKEATREAETIVKLAEAQLELDLAMLRVRLNAEAAEHPVARLIRRMTVRPDERRKQDWSPRD